MFFFRPLPWEYAVRNLFRRPARSLLTLVSLALVVLLVLVVVGFLRGLENSLSVSGDPRVVLIHSLGSSENLENSSVDGSTADIVSASLPAVQRRYGAIYASPELYLGTRVAAGDGEVSLGLIRGVTPAALLVRRSVQLVEGRWPGHGEVMIGRLAEVKLGRGMGSLAVGDRVSFEGQTWRISGRFGAAGSGLEAEVWCLLDELQQLLKRQDVSLVAITLAPGAEFAAVDEFCKERLDLELEATPEVEHYAALERHYAPVRLVCWLIIGLIAGAGVCAGLNVMYGAVVGRVRELATLQTLGFVRRAVALSLIQEGALLAAAASLLAGGLAVLLLDNLAVRFTMGAFTLRIDSLAVVIGCGVGLLLGVLGAIPPAIRALRLPVAEGLKAV